MEFRRKCDPPQAEKPAIGLLSCRKLWQRRSAGTAMGLSLIHIFPRRSDNTPVSIDSNMEDLLDKAMKQNFVPVLDARLYGR